MINPEIMNDKGMGLFAHESYRGGTGGQQVFSWIVRGSGHPAYPFDKPFREIPPRWVLSFCYERDVSKLNLKFTKVYFQQ